MGNCLLKPVSFKQRQRYAATRREWGGAGYVDMERSSKGISKFKTQTAKDWI